MSFASLSTHIAVLATVLCTSFAHASSRKTPWLYSPNIMNVGEVEYEQYTTWKTNKQSDSEYSEVRFRHSIEWGVAENLQMAVYFADWRYKKTSEGSDTYFHDVAVEAIWQLQAPTPDDVGIGLYGEIKYGDDFFELEGKLLLEMELDQVNILYNCTLEAEWEGQHLDDDKGVLENAIAVTYAPEPNLTYGIQAIWEIEFPGWSQQSDDVVYVGPSIAWQSEGWWITISPLFQATNVQSEPDLQVRLLFGIDF